MKKKEKSHGSRIKMYLQMPHIIAALIIFGLAIISLVISILTIESSPYLSSLIANIFAGLITGLIIYLLSAIKSITVFKIECQIKFLKGITLKCNEYFQMYSKMRLKKNSFNNTDEYYDYC